VSILPSSASDREYKVFVALPLSYSKYNRKTYPVVYLLDGNFYLELVTELSHLYRFFGKQLPELIIVGIGYDIEWKTEGRLDDFVSLRERDLTPTQMSSSPGSGEAGEFLKFIQQDLIPHIDANYRTDPTDRTIVGHSHGGLFSLYALFHAPETFTRYVAASPSLWWGDQVMFEYEEDFANEHADLPAKLFLSVGGLEEYYEISKKWVSNLEELHRRLEDRNYAGLDMELVIFEDETHGSVLPGALTRGLMTVFR
jgi:predicted alpha/beta superfamily hydrolase